MSRIFTSSTLLCLAAVLCLASFAGPGPGGRAIAAQAVQLDFPGASFSLLPNGNIVIVDPAYDRDQIQDAGVVYLLDGDTLQEISRLTGSRVRDLIGSRGVTVLPNGDWVVASPEWDRADQADAGAVTFCSMETGCSGEVSPDNSLVGRRAGDRAGSSFRGIVALNSGGYVVVSPEWDAGSIVDAGAVTYCPADNGCRGEISPDNSLTGSHAGDRIGAEARVTAFDNGDYLVTSPEWDAGSAEDAGAVTYCPGESGCRGEITPDNSLTGSSTDDRVGRAVELLPGNGWISFASIWDNGPHTNAGAITVCLTGSGCTGQVSEANSLVGGKARDAVGSVTWFLRYPNGDFVFTSPSWNNGSADDAGAVTRCSSTGCLGVVSEANSLVGSQEGDLVGNGGMLLLPNGAMLVSSQFWHFGTITNAGAVTFCPPAGCTGTVNPGNSLVGSHAYDRVGHFEGITLLPDGNYAVSSSAWDRGDLNATGAVTWCSGETGCTGEITEESSLIGGSAGDQVGQVIPFSDGRYLVISREWDRGGLTDAGAVTFCPGGAGCTGEITEENSLVGGSAGDRVGKISPSARNSVVELSAGSYAVAAPYWDNGSLTDVGAVVFCPPEGCTGPISEANSLTGQASGDRAGFFGLEGLGNGALVAASSYWDNGPVVNAGAVTYCETASACAGENVSPANSLVGSHEEDFVGAQLTEGELGDSIYLLPGGYIVVYNSWSGGAVTFCPNESGCTGPVSAQNSLIGEDDARVGEEVFPLPDGGYLVHSPGWGREGEENLGAVTTCPPQGCTGLVSPENSLTGSTALDRIGTDWWDESDIFILDSGDFVVYSPFWDSESLVDAAALTYCPAGGCTGPVSAENSIVGRQAGADIEGYELQFDFDHRHNRLIATGIWENIVSVLTLPAPVERAATAVSLSASAGELAQGQELLLTASVTSDSGPPPGQVTFFAGSTRLGRAALDPDGRALFSTTSLPPGLHSLTARYEGNYNFEPSTSEPVSVSVLPAQPTAITLSLSDSRPAPGQPLTLRAQVTSGSGPPSGAVAFYDGESLLGQAQLDGNGQASLTVALEAGSHSLSARYLGGDGYAASASAPVALQVGGAAPASPRLFLPLVGG